MRGKAPPHAVKRRLSGITPAYAGKSAFLVGVVGDFGDHPRVCGEKASFTNVLACGEGSPPRMRGKAWLQLYAIASARITPAYAGKSRIRAGRGAASGDHPRVCGEKRSRSQRAQGLPGSPPRMRGKGDWHKHRARQSGITPAYAGKSCAPRQACQRAGDHPRVCGEKTVRTVATLDRMGSPPRMRGKALRTGQRLPACGITPAYAGKSHLSDTCSTVGRDHPRVCGEKFDVAPPSPPARGSPPRMRGKVLAALMPTNALGITPAYAGKSAPSHSGKRWCWDHPRVCGEKHPLCSLGGFLLGSPPRMRGKGLLSKKCLL